MGTSSQFKTIAIRLLLDHDPDMTPALIESEVMRQLERSFYFIKVRGVKQLTLKEARILEGVELCQIVLPEVELPDVKLPTIKKLTAGRRKTDPIHYIKEPDYEQEQQAEEQGSNSKDCI